MDGLGFVLIAAFVISGAILLWMKTPSGKKWLASL